MRAASCSRVSRPGTGVRKSTANAAPSAPMTTPTMKATLCRSRTIVISLLESGRALHRAAGLIRAHTLLPAHELRHGRHWRAVETARANHASVTNCPAGRYYGERERTSAVAEESV